MGPVSVLMLDHEAVGGFKKRDKQRKTAAKVRFNFDIIFGPVPHASPALYHAGGGGLASSGGW